MTDKSLRETLHAAVPPAPDLSGLAARAEQQGKRYRDRRRAGTAALALCVIAMPVILGLRILGPLSDGEAASLQVDAAPCQDETSQGPRLLDLQAVSVRFCQVPQSDLSPDGPRADFPDAALTKDVTATVRALEASIIEPKNCEYSRTLYRIQISYKGQVSRDLPTQMCDGGFEILLKALGRQQMMKIGAVDSSPPSCAQSNSLSSESDAGPIDGPPDALVRTAAVAATRCTTTAAGATVATSVADPEELRAALLSDVTPGLADCLNGTPGQEVKWVIRLADGSVRTASYNSGACGQISFDNGFVGVGRDLIEAASVR